VGDAVAARRIPVQGPFLALLKPEGTVADWLFPRPSDALDLESGLRRLVPLDAAAWGGRSNLPRGVDFCAGLVDADPSKPKQMPAFWRWSDLHLWLCTSTQPTSVEGVSAPPVEARTHVAIDPTSGRAKDGMLFSTAGRRWIVRDGAIGLGLRTGATIQDGAAPVGGERRMARWRPASTALPTVPAAVVESAMRGAVRVMLATPAIFDGGWLPRRLFDAPEGSTLVSAIVGRPDVVSGWDLAQRRARPSRRCAPAGSVYFMRLGGDAEARRAWATSAWLAPRSDTDEDRLDGYGSLLLGVWDGQIATPAQRL
jgi:CRISPR-associated protein Cmr3